MSDAGRIAMELSGGCQCGAVRYHATERNDDAHICHCRMCQKAMGSFFAPLVTVARDKLTWTRGTPTRFRSSTEVYRGFCAACGTPLFLEDIDGTDIYITIGSLDHPVLVPPRAQSGMQGRMPWFDDLHILPDTGETGSDDPEWAEAIARTNNQHPDRDTSDWPPAGRAR